MNNTLHNGFRVLEFLAESGKELSVKEIAEHFSLPNSHICRLLKSLTEMGYTEQLPSSRKYHVSLKILHLANGRLKKEPLLKLARPYLHQLAEKLDAAVYITKAYRGYSLIIGVECPALFSEANAMVIGTKHSPTSSACGQICAAYASAEVRSALLDEIDWTAPGDFCGERERFEQELEKIRSRGYAVRDLPHVGAVAVPLFEEGHFFSGALGVMLPPERPHTPQLYQDAIESTVACGKLISTAQGCPPDGDPVYKKSARRKYEFC